MTRLTLVELLIEQFQLVIDALGPQSAKDIDVVQFSPREDPTAIRYRILRKPQPMAALPSIDSLSSGLSVVM